ncbi:MAG: OmpP1/FadL family transporter [Desulfobacterales bacterium]|nr:OmpP1/FadL family transporter [Desulfobacterales bacterium]
MGIKRFGSRLLTALGIFLLCASPALAGGLYLYEIGTPDVGLAAAGYAARAQDPSTVFTNPAGMTRLDRSELQLGIMPLYGNTQFNPDSSTTTTGPDGDGSAWLPAGSLFYVHSLSPDLKFGIGALGFFGLGLEYEDDWVGRYYVQEVTLQAFGVQPAVAYRVTDWLSVGAGVVALYGVFDEKVAVNNIDPRRGDGRIKLHDEDMAFQANLGLMLAPWKGTRFGLTYLSEADLDFEDRPQVNNLGPGLDALLGAKGLLDAKLNLGMTMPQAVMFSAYHDLTPRLAVMGNLGWQDWSRFGKVDVGIDAADTTSFTADRNYQDTWHTALGAQYRVAEPWLLSAGIAYDSSMVEDEDRTPDLPVGEAWRFGAGARYDWSQQLTLGLAYTLLWMDDLDMTLDRGPLAGSVSGQYDDAAIHFLNFNVNWKF